MNLPIIEGFPKFIGLPSIHLSFALIIYASVTLVWSTRRLSLRFSDILLAIVPSTLIMLWLLAFQYDKWFLIVVFLGAATAWITFVMSSFEFGVLAPGYIVALLLFPTNALFLMGFAVLSPGWSWFVAALYLVASLIVIGSQ